MTKTNPTDTSPTILESLTPADETTPDAAIPKLFWLLKDGSIYRALAFRAKFRNVYNSFRPASELLQLSRLDQWVNGDLRPALVRKLPLLIFGTFDPKVSPCITTVARDSVCQTSG